MGIIGNLMFAIGFKVQSNDLQNADRNIRRLRGDVEDVGDEAEKSESKFKRFGANLAKVGKFAIGAVAGIAASIGAIGMASFHASDEYQRAMNQIQVSTGIATVGMTEIKSISKNLYNQNLGEDWKDLADAVSITSQVTHKTGIELENTTKNALLMRDTFGFEINESIKATDTMMKNFGITSDQAFNLLAQGAQKGLNKSDELIDSANEYAPYFHSLGFSANQMFDTFAAGLEKGAFNLDKVGDAVKEFNIRAKDGSKSSSEAFKALGLDANKMSQTFAKGGVDAQKSFVQIVDAISKIQDPMKKNAIGVQLFGTQFEDLEKDVISAMGVARSQFDMTKGTMNEVSKIKYSSVGEAFKGIERQIETGILIPIGERLLPVLSSVSNWISHAFQSDALKSFGSDVDNVFGKIGNFFEPILHKANKVIGAFNGIGDTISWLFENGFDGEMEGVFQNVFQAMGFDPKSASVAVGYIKSVFDFFSESWNVLESVTSSVVDPIIANITPLGVTLTNIATIVWTVLGEAFKALTPIVRQIGDVFTTYIMPVIQTVLSFVIGTVLPKLTEVFAGLAPQISGVFQHISTFVSMIVSIVSQDIQLLANTFNFVFPFIKSVVLTSVDAIKGVLSGLLTALDGVILFITGVFSGNWGKAWTGIKSVFSGIWSSLGSILVYPINVAVDAINFVVSKINGINVSVPDWVPGIGGKSFGVKIPTIPHVGGYAKGGIVNKPELAWVGEGGDTEVIIPINKSQRSQDLYQTAGNMLGVTPANSPAASIYKNVNTNTANYTNLPPINLNFQITTEGKSETNIANEVAAQVKRVVQEIIESASRRQGLNLNG